MNPILHRVLHRLLGGALLVAAATTLSGCATPYLLDSEVRSFSGFTAPVSDLSFRFERLPSQQAPEQAQEQARVEALAEGALRGAGFRRDDAAPRYTVQASARVQRMLSPYAEPWDWRFGWSVGVRQRGVHLGLGGPFGRVESPWYRREVGLVVRELPGQRVVYETHALSTEPWHDTDAALAAMFAAALQGFPLPPAGPRHVHTQMGGGGPGQP